MLDETLSEQEQWELVKQKVRENYLWVLAGIALAVLGLSAWRWYQQRVENGLLAASKQYDQVLVAIGKHELATAVKVTGDLNAQHGGTGYAEQATLLLAQSEVAAGEQAKALEQLKALIGATADKELALLARVRAARLLIDQNKPDEALTMLSDADAGAYAASFAEVRGDALYAKGDRSGALKAYQQAGGPNAVGVDREMLKLKIAELNHG
jgi:predicted negative regulator of RcsB-dependent stress response